MSSLGASEHRGAVQPGHPLSSRPGPQRCVPRPNSAGSPLPTVRQNGPHPENFHQASKPNISMTPQHTAKCQRGRVTQAQLSGVWEAMSKSGGNWRVPPPPAIFITSKAWLWVNRIWRNVIVIMGSAWRYMQNAGSKMPSSAWTWPRHSKQVMPEVDAEPPHKTHF